MPLIFIYTGTNEKHVTSLTLFSRIRTSSYLTVNTTNFEAKLQTTFIHQFQSGLWKAFLRSNRNIY